MASSTCVDLSMIMVWSVGSSWEDCWRRDVLDVRNVSWSLMAQFFRGFSRWSKAVVVELDNAVCGLDCDV